MLVPKRVNQISTNYGTTISRSYMLRTKSCGHLGWFKSCNHHPAVQVCYGTCLIISGRPRQDCRSTVYATASMPQRENLCLISSSPALFGRPIRISPETLKPPPPPKTAPFRGQTNSSPSKTKVTIHMCQVVIGLLFSGFKFGASDGLQKFDRKSDLW